MNKRQEEYKDVRVKDKDESSYATVMLSTSEHETHSGSSVICVRLQACLQNGLKLAKQYGARALPDGTYETYAVSGTCEISCNVCSSKQTAWKEVNSVCRMFKQQYDEFDSLQPVSKGYFYSTGMNMC